MRAPGPASEEKATARRGEHAIATRPRALAYDGAVNTSRSVEARTLLIFAGTVILGGGNSPAVKYISCSSCKMQPFWAAGSRFIVAAVLFALIARFRGAHMPRGRALLGAVIFG